MERPEKLPEEFTRGMKAISIDASSIIYFLKTGILGYVAAEIELFSSQGVNDEVGWPRLPLTLVPVPEEMSNDASVLYVAETRGIPVLSEDREVLKEAEERNLPFYNALMILNYLLLKGRIGTGEYDEYLDRLKEISRYSREILEYGDSIRKLVEAELL